VAAASPETLQAEIIHAIQPIVDPDIGLSLVDLGLIRDVAVAEGGQVRIQMTLTSPGCPIGPELMAAVEHFAKKVPGVEAVDVELVWEPPWDPRTDATEDAKAELGIWD
jgi:metal-sulfur cluster biosynthetic enzyme